MEKSIYDLELHETLHLGTFSPSVLRVSGGWVYTIRGGSTFQLMNSVFVPFDNEFQPEPERSENKMFATHERRAIADKIQRILRETCHPELPQDREIEFQIHIEGADEWSYATIVNNGAVK